MSHCSARQAGVLRPLHTFSFSSEALDLLNPSADHNIRVTAVVDKMLDALLIKFDIPFVVGIKFIRHLLALPFIVHHKHAVAHNKAVVQIVPADGFDIVLQNVEQRAGKVRDEIQVAENADFVGLHPIELIRSITDST